MNNQTEQAREAVIDQYPLYLRWGQMIALYADLGLGSRWVVKRHLREGRINRVHLYGGRDHYTRESVVQLLAD